MLFTNRGLSEPMGYKGTAKSVVSSGFGTPLADPDLKTVLELKGIMPEGMDLVSSPSIAVAINDKGYLVPADGTLAPYGVIGHCLRSTAHLKALLTGNGTEQAINSVNSMDDLQGITPTVFQFEALFERGYAYKKDGASKKLFEFKPGCSVRPITTAEITTCLTDGTLPYLFGETAANADKTKAWYAGMPVVFDDATDKITQRVGRATSIIPGEQYNNLYYTNQSCFDFNLQGKDTAGTSRNVWLSIGEKSNDANYIKTIVEFYVAM